MPSDLHLPSLFDHTLLKADATEPDILTLCDDARAYGFASVCVNPVWVETASKALGNCDVEVCSVVGFPLGANRTEIKVAEAIQAAEDGASEIDMVANIGWLVSNRFVEAEAEIRKMCRQLSSSVVLKVIIECSLLSPEQWTLAARCVADAGAEYVKTGTGFAGPATVDQVATLTAAVGDRIKVKAAGGVRTLAQAQTMLSAGASRIGCSSTVAIMREAGISPNL
ncbi:deoxyribose-phosphate aldolase [bacterium]|nr:deoxyribose-phosphate aldolase [bacterium]MCB2201879.1 deoxyribose-phosphate aldolase [bacterium]